MQKKLVIFLSVFLILEIAAGFAYKSYRFNHPQRTGGKVTPLIQSDVAEGQAVNNLIKSLPISGSGFEIKSYDYARGVFVVQNNYAGPNFESEFDGWYSNSSISAVPKKLFFLQQ